MSGRPIKRTLRGQTESSTCMTPRSSRTTILRRFTSSKETDPRGLAFT